MISFRTHLQVAKWVNKYGMSNIHKMAEDGVEEAAELLRNELSKILGVQGDKNNRSAPGEPPRKQTGDLQAEAELAIEAEVTGNKVGVSVQSFSDKAPALEFGTWKMAPRPAWIPTFNRLQGQMKKIIRDSLRRKFR